MTKHIALGKEAPDFCLTDVNGQEVSLSTFRHKKHVILIFTRGFF